MAKILKISSRIIGISFEWLLILIILFAFIIRTSPVQTFIAKEVASYLSSELGAQIKIDRVAIVFFDEIAFDNFLVKDQQGDTILFSKTAFATFGDLSISDKSYTLKTASLDQALVHLQRDTTGKFNHTFIKEYFKSDKKKSPIKFGVTDIQLTNSRFLYDDNRKERKTYGVDYWHLDTKIEKAKVSSLFFGDDMYKGKIVELKATEKSGLVVKNVVATAEVSSKGMKLQNVQIFTKQSTIGSDKFQFLTNGFDDYLYFVDSVTFNANILESSVALNEIALFSPFLKGMWQEVKVKGSLSRQVKNLRISDLDLSFGKKSNIKGTIEIPDYRNPQTTKLAERIEQAKLDIQDIRELHLPESFSPRHMDIDSKIDVLDVVEVEDLRLDGTLSTFVITSKLFKTDIGSANFNTGLKFTKRDSIYFFTSPNVSDYDLKVNQFDLGRFLNREDVGIIDGEFRVAGSTSSLSNITFDSINGKVNTFEYSGYPYENISINKGKFKGNSFEGIIKVEDKFLNLEYEGTVDFNGNQSMDFTLKINEAILNELGIDQFRSFTSPEVKINLSDISSNGYHGTVFLQDLHVVTAKENKNVEIDSVLLEITRHAGGRVTFDLKTSLGNAKMDGKINLERLLLDIEKQFARVFPSLFKNELKEYKIEKEPDSLIFAINSKSELINDLIREFVPSINRIDPYTSITGSYDGNESFLNLELKSNSIKYNDYLFSGVHAKQTMDSVSMNGFVNCSQFFVNDSLDFRDLKFKNSGTNNRVVSSLSWEEMEPTKSIITWTTEITDVDHYNLTLDPSYFHVKDHKWEILNESKISIEGDTISVDKFKLERGNQFLTINGKVSDQDKHQIMVELQNFQIGELTSFITDEYSVEGKIDAWAFVSNPFKNLYYTGDAKVIDLQVNDRQIGDTIFLISDWDKKNQSVTLDGFLKYHKLEALTFKGDYYPKELDTNLNVNFTFEMMDIQFVNAFMNPEVLNDIKGKLDGDVNLSGTLTQPIIDGEVNLVSGSAKVEFLGTHFSVDGPIEVDSLGFYMNNVPVFDQDGNAGSLVASVYHENFDNFNFDLQFDLEDDHYEYDPDFPWRRKKLDRFLIMDTPYDPEYSYYGQGYATGTANIFGFTDNLEITVDLKTQNGTWLNIPMFGVGEIEEESEFIVFTNELNMEDTIVQKFDLLGVDLDLQIEVTPDVPVQIVFDQELGDIIEARGHGDINMKVDNFGHITMEGVYTVEKGHYDFAMQVVKVVVKQKFGIEEGGTITWTGDPYDADLNLKTFYRTNANIADISSDQLGSGTGGHQQVMCYMNLTESLLKPTIEFDIQAPNADAVSKTLIERVKSDPDELNRQFFSLLLTKKFLPLSGTSTANGSAALELVANQINSLLAQVSSEYKMNVSLDRDILSGDDKYEFGVSKGFLNDRLIISGSFGLENRKIDDDNNEQNLIGDVYIEYILNEDGTIRINIFNESTDKTIIYDVETGLFTQGAGLKYKEDFDNGKDIKVIQNFLDLFRKKENKRNKSHLAPVDQQSTNYLKHEDEITYLALDENS